MGGGPHRTRRGVRVGLWAAGLAVAVGALIFIGRRVYEAHVPRACCDDFFPGHRMAGPHEVLSPGHPLRLPHDGGSCLASMWSNADGCHVCPGDCCKPKGRHIEEELIDWPDHLVPCSKSVILWGRRFTCICGPPITDGGDIEARKAWLAPRPSPAGSHPAGDGPSQGQRGAH